MGLYEFGWETDTHADKNTDRHTHKYPDTALPKGWAE